MTTTEELEYKQQLDDLYKRLNKRNKKILFLQEKIEEMKKNDDYSEMNECLQRLDILKAECRLDQELKEDLSNMIEVEHFLDFGNGRTFDPEY